MPQSDVCWNFKDANLLGRENQNEQPQPRLCIRGIHQAEPSVHMAFSHQLARLWGQMGEEPFLGVWDQRQNTLQCLGGTANLAIIPWVWAPLTSPVSGLGANNGRHCSRRPGDPEPWKQGSWTVLQKMESQQETTCCCLSHGHLQSSQINGCHCCLFFPPDFSKMLWQFVWCQRVSVWLRGMCLHSNIWGLIINIRNIFLKEKINMLGEKWLPNELDFARKIQVQRKKKILEWRSVFDSVFFFFFWSLHLYSHY